MMIGKFFPTALRKTPRDPDPFDQDVEGAAREVGEMQFPTMVPLQPPSAQNDDPLRGFCRGVEEDLQAAGYLP
jgi:hypothetical protein